MTVLVTGASGHVGANLVRELLRRGERVRVLIREHKRALEGLDVERFMGDVCEPDSIRPAMEGVERIYHLAAVISIDGDRDGRVPAVNVDGVRNVAEAALELGIPRMVHCSSIHAFDQDPPDQPLDETRQRATARPGHPAYDLSKARGEEQVREVVAKGLDAVICNPTAIIGPNDFERSRVGRVFTDLVNRRLPSLIDGGFDWVDVRDVSAGLIAAGDKGRAGESYLLSGRWASVRELAAVVEAITGIAPPRITSPMWLARIGAPFVVAYGRVVGREPLYTMEALRALRANRHIDNTKARTELGYAPRPLEQSVRDAIAWLAMDGAVPPDAVRDAGDEGERAAS